MKPTLTLLTAQLLAPLAALRAADTWHQPRAAYKCLYNAESLMHCNENTVRQSFAALSGALRKAS